MFTVKMSTRVQIPSIHRKSLSGQVAFVPVRPALEEKGLAYPAWGKGSERQALSSGRHPKIIRQRVTEQFP